MTASVGKSGFTTTLKRATNTIAELTKIGGVSVSAGEIMLTHLNSDSGYAESIQGLRDAGDLALEGSFIVGDTSGQIGLLTDFDAGTAVEYIITFPTAVGATWTFNAWVKAFTTGDVTPEGALTFTATLRITGKPTLAITASVNVTALVVTTGTLVPVFAAATYSYVAHVATGEATVTMTATFAAGACTLTYGTASLTLATTVPSSAVTLGAAGSITPVTITLKETGKTAKIYTIWVERA